MYRRALRHSSTRPNRKEKGARPAVIWQVRDEPGGRKLRYSLPVACRPRLRGCGFRFLEGAAVDGPEILAKRDAIREAVEDGCPADAVTIGEEARRAED